MKTTETNGLIIKTGKLIYSEIKIKAPREKVWGIFTDFNRYKSWNPFIKTLSGKVEVGNKIEILLSQPNQKAMAFKPKVLVFKKEEEFRWIGKLLVGRIFDGEHVFKLIDNSDGTTMFIQYERFRGILVPFLNKMLESGTRSAFELMNKALKEKCEKN